MSLGRCAIYGSRRGAHSPGPSPPGPILPPIFEQDKYRLKTAPPHIPMPVPLLVFFKFYFLAMQPHHTKSKDIFMATDFLGNQFLKCGNSNLFIDLNVTHFCGTPSTSYLRTPSRRSRFLSWPLSNFQLFQSMFFGFRTIVFPFSKRSSNNVVSSLFLQGTFEVLRRDWNEQQYSVKYIKLDLNTGENRRYRRKILSNQHFVLFYACFEVFLLFLFLVSIH